MNPNNIWKSIKEDYSSFIKISLKRDRERPTEQLKDLANTDKAGYWHKLYRERIL